MSIGAEVFSQSIWIKWQEEAEMATTESRCFHKKIVINQQASDNLNKKTKPPEKQRLISKCIVLNMALDT